MRQRDREHYAWLAAVAEEKRLTKEMADRIIDCADLSAANFNTVRIHQDIGRIKALREIIS
jgi:hypothetical protein